MRSVRRFPLCSLILAAALPTVEAQQVLPSTPPDRPSPHSSIGDPQLAKYQSVSRGKSLVQTLTLAQKLRGRLGEVAAGLGEQLSASDRALLLNYATLERDHLNQVRGQLRAAEQEVCRRRHNMNVVALEAAFAQGIRVVADESNTYYRTILNALSNDGRRRVLQYVDKKIIDGEISEVRFDTAALARERPDLAMRAVEETCTTSPIPSRPVSQPPATDAAFGTVTR